MIKFIKWAKSLTDVSGLHFRCTLTPAGLHVGSLYAKCISKNNILILRPEFSVDRCKAKCVLVVLFDLFFSIKIHQFFYKNEPKLQVLLYSNSQFRRFQKIKWDQLILCHHISNWILLHVWVKSLKDLMPESQTKRDWKPYLQPLHYTMQTTHSHFYEIYENIYNIKILIYHLYEFLLKRKWWLLGKKSKVPFMCVCVQTSMNSTCWKYFYILTILNFCTLTSSSVFQLW